MQTEKWQVGDKIANRYEIYKILGGEGKSGMGIVYICYDHEHKMVYALKTFQERFLFSEEKQKLFEREALIWTELESYPYIVRAYWVEKIEGRLFIFLEYVAPDIQGRNTLTRYLGNLSLPETIKLSIQFCYGMEYAYSKGVKVHRDIKPDNIMIAQNLMVKITDFGLAKAFDESEMKEISSDVSRVLNLYQTKSGMRGGTLPYMAPEVFDGVANVRSDIYSFGIVLYQMVCNGKLPFEGSSVLEFAMLHKLADVPQLISPLSQIINTSLSKNPVYRFQNFAEIRCELEKVLLDRTGEMFTSLKVEEYGAIDWLNKSYAFGSLCHYEEAIECSDKALLIDSTLVEALGNKSAAYLCLGKNDEVIRCCDKAVQIDPKDVSIWSNKGGALVNLGLYSEAVSCYDEAIKINPEDARIWYNKGLVIDKLHQLDKAIICFDKAINLNPRFAEAITAKGRILGQLGLSVEEIKFYDKAISINPKYSNAWGNKGNALLHLGKYDEAILCFERVLINTPEDPVAWLNKGIALTNLGQLEEAIECFNEAMRINPQNTNAWSNKGVVYGKLSKFEDAIKCFDMAIEIDRSNVEVWYNKGIALVQFGRYLEAIKCFDEAININPNLDYILSDKGYALGKLNQHQEAVKCYNYALQINPKNEGTLIDKGATLYKLGNYHEAKICAEQALKINPENTNAQKLMQICLRHLGK